MALAGRPTDNRPDGRARGASIGTFYYSIEIGDPMGERFERTEALVDTGAMFSVFPATQLQRLGVTPYDRTRLLIGDGRWIDVDLGQTSLRVNDKMIITIVIFGEEALGPVLGAYALEGLLLGVDPANRRLIPIDGLWPLMIEPRPIT